MTPQQAVFEALARFSFERSGNSPDTWDEYRRAVEHVYRPYAQVAVDALAASRREVLEEAAKVADHCEATGVMGAKVVAAAVRALAASQPAPAAEPNFAQCCASTNVAGCDCVNKDHIHLDLDPPRTQTAPAADTGQAADEAEELRKVLYGFVQGNGDFTAARRLLGDRTYTHHAALRQKEGK